VLLRLDRPAAEKPAAAPAVAPAVAGPATAKPPAPEPKTKLTVTGDYPFEIVEGGRVISAASDSHEVSVAPRARVFLRNREYFLNLPVQLDGSREFGFSAPGLGRLQLTAGETCLVTIGDRNLGEPPVVQVMAAGTHTAIVECGGQAAKRQTFTITAGSTSKVQVR
jgi:hypothetical protein